MPALRDKRRATNARLAMPALRDKRHATKTRLAMPALRDKRRATNARLAMPALRDERHATMTRLAMFDPTEKALIVSRWWYLREVTFCGVLHGGLSTIVPVFTLPSCIAWWPLNHTPSVHLAALYCVAASQHSPSVHLAALYCVVASQPQSQCSPGLPVLRGGLSTIVPVFTWPPCIAWWPLKQSLCSPGRPVLRGGLPNTESRCSLYV